MLLSLVEAKAAPEGTEVTRKDGRTYRKTNGKWVYQAQEKPPSSSSSAGGEGRASARPSKSKKAPPSIMVQALKGRQPSEAQRLKIFPVSDLQLSDLHCKVSSEIFRKIMNSDGMASKDDFRAAIKKEYPTFDDKQVNYLYYAAPLAEMKVNGDTHLVVLSEKYSAMTRLGQRLAAYLPKVFPEVRMSTGKATLKVLEEEFEKQGVAPQDFQLLLKYMVPSDVVQGWKGPYRQVLDQNNNVVGLEEMTPEKWTAVKEDIKAKAVEAKKAAERQKRYEAAWKKHMATPAFKRRVAKHQAEMADRLKRHQIPAFESVERAQAWAEKEHPHVEWDFSGADMASVHPSLQRYHLLAKEWPSVNLQMRYLGTYEKGAPKNASMRNDPSYWNKATEWAHAGWGGDYIGLNPRVYNDVPSLQRGLEHSVQTGFSPKGANTIDSIMTHEFGHILKFSLQKHGSGFISPHDSGKKVTDIARIVRAFVKFHKPTEKLSRYSLKNEEEAWAESFTAIYHSPPEDWTPYTAAQFELLTALKEVTHRGSLNIDPTPAQERAAERAAAKLERLTGISLDTDKWYEEQ